MSIKADVVIIGGGIVGCSIAYNLAKAGIKPVVIEKSDIGGEASGANGGGVRQSARNVKEMPLAMESIKIFGQLNEELGADVEYVRQGNLRLCTDEEELETMRKSVENQKLMGLTLEMLDRKQVLDINPYVGEKVIGAGFCPTDGHANPLLATYAFFNKAKSLGAIFYTHEEVKEIRLKKGKVNSIVTDKNLFETDLVVNAAGIAGRKIANMVGLDIPLRSLFSEALITEPFPPLFQQMIGHVKGRFYGRQTPHGSFFWGGFIGREEFIYQGGKPLFHNVGPAIAQAVIDYFPILKKLHITRTWSGLIAQISDGIPVLGLVKDVPGFVFATGFSGHGFGISPIIGRLISELILDCRTSLPIFDFRYSRFTNEDECDCPGKDVCTTLTAVCPAKRDFVKSI